MDGKSSSISLLPSYSFCDVDNFQIVFADEFESEHLNETIWSVDLSGGDSRVRQAQGTKENVYVENGSLVLRTERQKIGGYNYSSGAVETKGKVSWEGTTRVCIRARLPSGGKGIWPAHWLMPDNDACWPANGEIDIMEMVNSDGVTHGTYHWKVNGCADPHSSVTGQIDVGDRWNETFHEFAVEYSASHILFALDGKVFKNITGDSTPPAQFFNVPYYVILNTAIDGPWPEPANNETVLPAYHLIDYVRVAQPTRGGV